MNKSQNAARAVLENADEVIRLTRAGMSRRGTFGLRNAPHAGDCAEISARTFIQHTVSVGEATAQQAVALLNAGRIDLLTEAADGHMSIETAYRRYRDEAQGIDPDRYVGHRGFYCGYTPRGDFKVGIGPRNRAMQNIKSEHDLVAAVMLKDGQAEQLEADCLEALEAAGAVTLATYGMALKHGGETETFAYETMPTVVITLSGLLRFVDNMLGTSHSDELLSGLTSPY